ncbi:MAG: DUF1330 domain-containing protein [Alphaproteobacteria bacterium]|nr:DUF1330 domain-containing protein [Alphaproteobacteria bacterium]
MAKGYWVVGVTVREAARYPEYVAAVGPVMAKFGGKYLVRGGQFEAVEGKAHARNVVIEFKDYATALACYRSPEYAKAQAIRAAIADSDLIIIEGFDG